MISNDSFLVAEKAEVEVPTMATLVETASANSSSNIVSGNSHDQVG